MPKEFIRTSEPFYLDVQDDGTWSEYRPGNSSDEEAGFPDDLDRSEMYVRGVRLSWTPELHLELQVGIFTMSSHEPYARKVMDGETMVSLHPLTHTVAIDHRHQAQALVRQIRRARNNIWGADE